MTTGRFDMRRNGGRWSANSSEWNRRCKVILLEQRWCPGYPAGTHNGAMARTTTVERIVPLSEGGSDERANLRAVCGPCSVRGVVALTGLKRRHVATRAG